MTTTPVCLICNGSCASNRNSVHIFHKESQTCSDRPLHVVMSEILDKAITEESVHSQVICKKCFKMFDQIEELDQQMIQIKTDLINNHNNSMLKFSSGEFAGEFIDEKPKNELCKDNIVPKKILDIPSSDDETSTQVLSHKTTAQTIEDIEMELEKIHGMDDEDTGCHDIGPVDNSSESDFDPSAAMQADTAAQLGDVTIKVEAGAEFNTNTLGDKPNILKKKTTILKKPKEEEACPQEIVTASRATHDGTAFTCLLCADNAVLRDAKAMMQHVREVHDVRLYICDVCGMDFRKRNELSAHLDEHVATEEGDFQCEVCNRIFSNLRLFRIHKRMHYPQNKAWTCETCGKKYSSKNLLEEHINTHTGIRPYVCMLCGKDFASKYTFKAHEKTHEVRPRPFRCSQCPKSFLSQQNLSQHERTHSGIKEYACHLCGKQFGSAHNLEVHSIVHTGYKPYGCGLCGKAFARKAEIRDHERTHTGERPYQCEFCGATFSQRSNLQSHKRATHYDDKRYKCEECGKGFKRRRLLDYHIKAAHTGERPFKCEVCEATFVYPEHFKKHRRIHTGEKPFLCEVCGKAFNSRDNRNAHRFVHSDKKPYECLVCGAGFMRKPLLYKHMQDLNHLNDTIVVNQPRLTTDDDQIVTVNADGEMEIVDHVLVEGTATISENDCDDQMDASEHIIIDAEQIGLAEEDAAEEDEEILSADAFLNGETQIIDTPDGPIQLVKVRIPNDNGEEEEAWIKIVPE